MKNHSKLIKSLTRRVGWTLPWVPTLAFTGMLITGDAWAQTATEGARIVTIPPPRPRSHGLNPPTVVLAQATDRSELPSLGAPIGPASDDPTSRSNPDNPLPTPSREEPFPRIVPIDPLPPVEGMPEPRPKVLHLRRDSTGLVPGRPPGPPPLRSTEDVSQDVVNLVEQIKEPEAELSVVVGESRIIQSRRNLSRVVVANPTIADVELLADQPDSRLLNIYGRTFGSTSLVLWDETNRPVSFRVRVTLDCKDLESRINQAFPGAQVKVRQVGPQVILEGQVPDSKMMSDILSVVTMTVRTSGGLRVAGAAAGGGGAMGGGGGAMGGGGMGGGGGAMGGGMGGAGGGLVIVNRVVVPGPRQVLLHVKIAELNRQAIRQLGISWLNAKGESIIGSPIGGIGGVFAEAAASHAQSTNPRGLLTPVISAFEASGGSTSGGTLFGVFDAGRFSLFINALRNNSLAKILAEPNLVALDGQPARFLVGGQFPFPVPQSSSIPGGTAVVTIQFRRFGTILDFIPQILPNDVIRLDVEPVISRLNFAQGTVVNGGPVPSIDERSARTVVELREGQTLAIAGLLQLSTNAQTVRIPGLGDLPLVGPWFSNNQINTVETETIVLVTPELVAPLNKHEVTEAPGDRVFQPSDAEFYFLGRIEGKLGREFRATKAEQDPLNIMKHFQSEQQWVIGPHGHAD